MVSKLTIIQQNDTHGCIEIHPELYWKENSPMIKKTGGFSRIQHYVNQMKKQNPNVLFFDGGDLFHGTLPLVASKGEAIIPILARMEIDAFVPGNWDFAYGKTQLEKLMREIHFPGLACNVKDTDTKQFFGQAYVLKKLHGLTVAVIGLTYPYVDKTMPASFSEGLSFSLGVEEVRQILEEVKDKADLIILISHMGLPLDVKLATLVSGIDIILSGHSHDRITKPIEVDGTFIVQAGSSASFLGKLDLTWDAGRILDLNYELMEVNEEMEEDVEIKQLVQEALSPFVGEREDVVGYTETLLHRMTLNEAPMDRLITDAYMHAFPCDVSFSHGWRYGTPIPPGPLSIYDLHSIIPTNPKMFLLEMNGKTLWEKLEKNLEMVFSPNPFEQKGGYILRSSGLFMTYKPYNPAGHRIQNLLIGGQEIDFNKTYRIAGGGEQLFKDLENKKSYQDSHAIDVIASFLKEKGPFKYDGTDRIISV